VTPGFFRRSADALKAGRLFDERDRENAPNVIIVSERLARQFWPTESAIASGWKGSEWMTPWREIVGVVNDIKLDGVENNTPMMIYLPLAQSLTPSVVLIARTDGRQTGTGPLIRKLVADLNNSVPVYDIRTMDEVFGVRVGQQRLTMIVFAVFGGVALLLAAVGLYGVVSHGVADRTREIGVRVALGATPRQVLRLFLSQGALTTTIGVVVGAGAALGLTRYLKDLLFETTPNDPVTIAAVIVMLFVVSLVACYLPALRAARVDPTSALRGE
jgi:putative ABC transport system permease protein